MGAWKDYLKLSILLSPNHASIYNIVAGLHDHLVKKNPFQYLVSLMGRESPID
jgi:hypothetical protein